MNPSSLNLSPIKDGRRILGEKSANACLSPVGKRTAVDSTPVKRTALHENSSPPKKLLPSPTFVSRKRSIDQVEDIQTDNGSLPAQRVPPAQLHETGSPQPTIIDSSQPNNDTDAIDSNTYSIPPEEKHQHQHGPTQRTPGHELQHRTSVPEDPETRKIFIQEKATLLRTRIQNAMHHIRDHQLDRRLSALEAHSRKYPRLSSYTSTSALQRPDSLTPSQPPSQTPPPADSKPMPDNGLSSPPLSTDNANQHDQMRTPTQKDFPRRNGSPVQLSSPPVSDAESDDGAGDTEKISTPSQKGDAVDGLLKLMKTEDR